MAATYDNGALRVYLLNDADVNGMVAGRVFAEELPRQEAGNMPRHAVLIMSAGGAWVSRAQSSNLPIDGRMKDVFCYGPTPYESRRLFDAVHQALKNLTRREVTPTGLATPVLLFDAVKVGGPTGRRDPETNWPFTFASYSVMAAETA